MTKIAVQELHPLFIAFGRATIAAFFATLLLFFSGSRKNPLPTRADSFCEFVTLPWEGFSDFYFSCHAIRAFFLRRGGGEKQSLPFGLLSLAATFLVLLFIVLHNMQADGFLFSWCSLTQTLHKTFWQQNTRASFLKGNLFLLLAITSVALGGVARVSQVQLLQTFLPLFFPPCL